MRVIYPIFCLIFILSACNSTKFVSEGQMLLDKVEIKSDIKDISHADMYSYLRQTPNVAVFSLIRMQLGVYNLAGKDSSRWYNKMLKRMGDPPVIYNEVLTSISTQQLQQLCKNKGYIQAEAKSSIKTKNKKVKLTYTVTGNKPYRIGKYTININDSTLSKIAGDSSRSLIKKDLLFDVDQLNAERERITNLYRQNGHYNFNKDFLSFTADSTLENHRVDLSIELRDILLLPKDSIARKHYLAKYKIRNVVFETSGYTTTEDSSISVTDTIKFKGFTLITPKKKTITLDALIHNTYINPKSFYSDRAVDKTFQALNSLGPVKYVNINFKEVGDSILDCKIKVIPSKTITISSEIEGTYTDGYWGGAWNINVTNRNIFGGAEALSTQIRGAVESQETVWAQEFSTQLTLRVPKFVFPIGSYNIKRSIHANTEFVASGTYQTRPGEFTTTNLTLGMGYTWSQRYFRHRFQFIELSYVYFPVISQEFKDAYLNVVPPKFNPYNYQDHFIMRTGYSGSFSNISNQRPLQNYWTARYSIETAGNILYAINNAFGGKKDPVDNSYRFLNVRYAQYSKAEINVTHHQIFDKSNRLVYHLGAGVGIPYGNADVIPYEKRFYSGGANSVRGWGESMLGPGNYERIISRRRDFNQVGDVKLDLNFEYRSKLFWKLEGALFVDAGNIWTIKDYETQKEGTFHFSTFANQLALAYGAGIRLDFSFFIARIDLGIKLFNPALSNSYNWRLQPNWNDDFAMHFAIGYPF